MSVENLPTELLSYMLRFLSLSDRQEAALTCKRWYQASLDPGLHKDTIITIRAPTAPSSQLHQLGQRKSANLVLSHIDSSSNCLTVLRETGRHLGPHLESLSLKGSDVTSAVFMDMVSNCPNLQKLDLSRCNSLFMSGILLSKNQEQIAACFQHLTCLNLDGIRYLSDTLLNRLVAVAPNLQRLSLASCNIAFEVVLCPTSEGRVSMSYLTVSNLVNILKERATKIKSLNLSHTGVSNSALKAIAAVPNLQLEEIYLRKCSSMGNEGVKALVEKQTELKVFDANGCRDLSDTALLAICDNLLMLKELDIQDWVQVSTYAAESLSCLSQLVRLNMTNCHKAMLGPGATSSGKSRALRARNGERVSPVKLPTGLGSGKLANLRDLNLSCCMLLDDDAVIGLTKSLPKLQMIDLASCVAVSDASVHAISKNLPHLQKLRLAWCKKITDFGLLGVDKNCPSISVPDEASKYSSDRFTRSHSNIGFFKGPSFDEKIQKVSEEALESLKAKSEISLSMLTNLRHLDFTACAHLTDVGIKDTIRFQQLQVLNLSLCPNISDASIMLVALNNPSLGEVHLAQCHQVTDQSIITLAQCLPRLHHLDICGCDQVTDRSLEALIKYAPRLKHLNISQCVGVTSEGIDNLQASLYGLQTLQLGHSAVGAPTAFYMPNYF
ncbi:uncharacterized protein [Amphiura filiformis]|uniref:uncharacterized protein n=1 Tax=Amphiura filiformis TaxID=82378 RepID=UPI003B222B38